MNLDERYASESPHRALAEWLHAWEQRDWDRLVVACQPSWRAQHDDARQQIMGAWQILWLKRWSIAKDLAPVHRIENPIKDSVGGHPFVVITDLPCRVWLDVGEGDSRAAEVWTTILARVVRETVDGNPAERDDPAGRWWVNPVSMTRSTKTRRRAVKTAA